MFERLTDRARRVLVLAQEEARLLNHSFIGTEHILLGLIHEGEGLAAKALEAMGIQLEAVREKVEETIGPAGTAREDQSPPFTPRAKKVLELSLREALQLGHNYIGTEHMLLGLVREGEGVAAQVLISMGADLSRVRQNVIQLLKGYSDKDPASASRAFEPWLTRELPRLRPGEAAAVGDEWTAQVVRPGRKPEHYQAAYQALAEIVSGLGAELDDLDASFLSVTTVETNEGPGLRLVIRRWSGATPAQAEDEPSGEPPDEQPEDEGPDSETG